MDERARHRLHPHPPALPLDVWNLAVILEAPWHPRPYEIWDARMGRAAQHVSVSALAAAVFSRNRFVVPWLDGTVGGIATQLHAPVADLYLHGRRRGAFHCFLYWVHADRFSDLRRGVHARAARGLVPALAPAAAALLLPADDVLRAFPLVDGRCPGQARRMARRGTRSARACRAGCARRKTDVHSLSQDGPSAEP